MEIFSQIIKLFFRIKYWLIFLPLFAALIAIMETRHLKREYEVSTTIYTGIASGFTIESGIEAGRVDWSSVNNGMDNLISIIKSKATLRNVSLRLYTQHMIYGDSTKDNNYIQAQNYRNLLRITPKEVRALIDKSSEERTIENLNRYEKASPTNFVYGLFNWFHHHYSYTALSRIEVKRIFNSDMLEIKFSADDPGVAYNTLIILSDEFAKQYKLLRFGETNDVVEYFRNELIRHANKLRNTEDSLTDYSVENRVINYEEQTKQIATLAKEYDLIYSEVLLRYSSAVSSIKTLEARIQDLAEVIETNSIFINKLNEVSELSSQVARLETFQKDTSGNLGVLLSATKEKLRNTEREIKELTANISKNKYTKEGAAITEYVEKWVEEILNREKASAELKEMKEVRGQLDSQYEFFSPIGSTLKRIERDISFTEQSYLAIQESLNAALMKQKTLQMSSANLKPINPPLFPISPVPTKRKLIVIATYVAVLVFVLMFFIILELFDRTVRDRMRAERLIQAPVLGAFPRAKSHRNSNYNLECESIATNYLANSIIPFLNPKERPDIINFISTEEGTGKSLLINLLYDYWTDRGLKIRVISWHENDLGDSKDFLLSNNLYDFYDYDNEDVIMVEHRSILKSAIPAGLLKEASLNLVIVRADKVWRDIDKIALDRLKVQAQDTPVQIYLTQSSREVTEAFVGMLPPYSRFREFAYRMAQFGLTSK